MGNRKVLFRGRRISVSEFYRDCVSFGLPLFQMFFCIKKLVENTKSIMLAIKRNTEL